VIATIKGPTKDNEDELNLNKNLWAVRISLMLHRALPKSFIKELYAYFKMQPQFLAIQEAGPPLIKCFLKANALIQAKM